MKASAVVLLSVAVALAGCDWMQPKAPPADERRVADRQAMARRLKQACGSAETYDRLKALAFDEAVKVRRAESPLLERLSVHSVVRMEAPVAKSRDESLNVTVCAGHLVLELPPGTEDAFDGDRRLEADIEYAAQEAVDGSGLVYQMQGAEPIIYRLAAIDLQRTGPRQRPPATETAAVEPPPLLPPVHPAQEIAPAPDRALAPRPARPAPAPTEADARADAPAPAPPRAAARPSFNCRYARSRVEKMVCSSEQLARQDRAMSSAFYAALAAADAPTRAALRASRDRFLAYRDRCGSETCVAQVYADRITEIRDIEAGRF